MSQVSLPPRRWHQWLGFGLISLLLIGFVVQERYESHKAIKRQEMARLQTFARLTDTNLTIHLLAIDLMMIGLRDQQVRTLASPANHRFLPTTKELLYLAETTPGARTVSVLDASGTFLASSRPETVGINVAYRPYFQTAQTTRDPKTLIVSSPFETILKTFSIQLVRPIFSTTGKFRGAVTVTLDPSFFETMLSTSLYADDLRCLLIHEDGIVFQAVGDFKPATGVNLDKPGSMLHAHKESQQIESFLEGRSYATGDQRIGVVRTVDTSKVSMDKHLFLTFTRNPNKLFAAWQIETRQITILMLALLSCGSMIIALHQRRQRAAWQHSHKLYLERQATRQLQLQAAREVEDLYDKAPCGYHTLDAEGCFLRINQTELDWLGLTRNEVIGKLHFTDLLDANDSKKFQSSFSHWVQFDSMENMEFSLRHKNGKVFTVLINSAAVRDADGKLLFCHSTLTDISERKSLEIALAVKTEQFETILNHASVGISMIRERITVWANPMACAMFGYKPKELIGHPASILYPSQEAYTSAGLEIHPALRAGKPVVRDIQFQRKDGTLIWGRATLKIVDPYDVPHETIAIIEDITQRKSIENANRELLNLISELPDFVATLGLDQVVNYINPAGLKLLGLPADTPPSQIRMQEVHPAWAFEKLVQEAFPAAAAEGNWHGELALLDSHGQEIPVYQTVLLHRDEKGQPSYLSTLIRDISIEKRAAQEMLNAKQAAELANKAKSQFISNMSHDIRTPLNALLNYGQLLETASLDPMHRDQLNRLNLAGNTLLGLVNDILDFSKIEAGELQLSEEPIDLQSKIDELAQVMGIMATQKGLSLIIDPLPADMPVHYLCDSLRLRQILFNLVGNAIKFTQKGHVKVNVTALPMQDPSVQKIRFEVSDTGIGISADDRAKLFTRFNQVDQGITRRFGGTGLGLAIVKELAEFMGGKVDVRSQPGQGSTFGVEILLKFANQEEIQQISLNQKQASAVEPNHLQLDGLRILVVDDSDMNLDISQYLLSQAGAQVLTCDNGLQALDILRNSKQRVDIVLMDVQMPVMDGNTTVQLIRQDPLLHELPVIAMTAGATRSERELSMQAGMNDYVTKPFDPKSLVKTICRQIELRRGESFKAERPVVEAPPSPVTETSQPWPEIAGIDIAKARHFLSDRWEMFILNAKWMMREFGRYAEKPTIPETDSDFKTMLLQLHTMAGNAGLLGATDLMNKAREAEQLGRQGDKAALQSALETLSGMMQVLKTAIGPILEAEEVRQAQQQENLNANAVPLDNEALQELIEDLDLQRLMANQRYKQLKPALACVLSQEDAAQLDAAMERLNYVEAKTILETSRRSAPSPQS